MYTQCEIKTQKEVKYFPNQFTSLLYKYWLAKPEDGR